MGAGESKGGNGSACFTWRAPGWVGGEGGGRGRKAAKKKQANPQAAAIKEKAACVVKDSSNNKRDVEVCGKGGRSTTRRMRGIRSKRRGGASRGG